MAKNEDEQPELHITDDMNDAEPETEVSHDSEKPQESHESSSENTTEEEPAPASTPIAVKDGTHQTFKQKVATLMKTKKGKVLAIILGLLLILGVLLSIPATRYAIAGTILKKDVTLTIIDQDSKKPISSATVALGSHAAVTDAKGVAIVRGVPVGEYQLLINKKYYTAAKSVYLVPILSAPTDPKLSLQATGRNVEITVTNKITGKPVKGADLTISGSSAKTDEKGIANIILPVQAAVQKGVVSTTGYNQANFEIGVKNSDDQKATVQLTPNGEMFFLSKRTGKINIMKTNLDGSDQSVLVEGTGNEDDSGTVLLATTDWKYGALLAVREGDKPKLYLLNNGTLSVIDEGDASFQLIGWSGHQFAFLVTRNTKNYWDDKRQALKSYNADTGKLTTIDQTQGAGSGYYDYAAENIANVYAVGNTLVYTKAWDLGSSTPPASYKSSITSVDLSGTNKKSLQDFPANQFAYFEAKLYSPDEIYFRAVSRVDSKSSFYEYEDGKVSTTTSTNDQKFYNAFYATYLRSPSGNKTLWYEPRDGKNVIFVGDRNGRNSREVGVSEDVPYGWFSDDYIFFARKSSELYIYGADMSLVTDTTQPLKITDFHKPALNFQGYGGGYGGQ